MLNSASDDSDWIFVDQIYSADKQGHLHKFFLFLQ